MLHNKLNFITKSLLVVSFLVLGGIASANAQAPGTAIKFNAENSFALRGKVFPAGEYTITRTSGLTGSDSLVLRGEGGSAIFNTTPTSSATAAEDTQVLFEKIDGVNFLSQIRVRGESAGKSIPISKAELRQIAKVTRKKSNTDTTGL